MHTAYIALGANLGDARAALEQALAALGAARATLATTEEGTRGRVAHLLSEAAARGGGGAFLGGGSVSGPRGVHLEIRSATRAGAELIGPGRARRHPPRGQRAGNPGALRGGERRETMLTPGARR